MCHFIALILPESRFDLAKRSGHHLVALTNASLSESLHPSEIAFRVNSECDCGTSLGAFERQSARASDATLSIESLRKKGWSESKIQRWLQQKHGSLKAHARSEEAKTRGDLEAWCSTLSALMEDTQSPYVGLLLHWFNGRLEDEPIQIASRVSLPLDAGLPDALYRIKENVIYEIRRPS